MSEDKRFSMPSKSRIRSLKQFADMSDEEFDEYWVKRQQGVANVADYEERIKAKMDEFANDYDIDDLKANDKLTLRSLAQAFITLDDLESYSYALRMEGIDSAVVQEVWKIENTLSSLRRDIVSYQDALKISRKIRKGDKEESVIKYIDDLKEKARKFYQSKMAYVYCPECGMLLGTVWANRTDNPKNKVRFVCHRELEDGKSCGTVVNTSISELYETNETNVPELQPEAL